MAILKGKTEGGSGGKRGHSNMDHWVTTEEIKDGSRKQRRLGNKELIAEEIEQSERGAHRCRSCGGVWEVTVTIPPHIQEATAATLRAGAATRAIVSLLSTGLALPIAKAIVLHIATPVDHCHRCRRLLPRESIAECQFCHALNYNW